MNFTNKEGISLVNDLIKTIQENRDYLSKVDGAIGDGDHGINMSKGFTMAEEELKKHSDYNMSEGLMVLSKMLMGKIGGSMGPLYGNLFRGMATVSKDKDIIDSKVVGDMLEKAYSNIASISSAKPGDKTLMDVLDPAVKKYVHEINMNKNMIEALNSMAESADEGLESTKDMVAKIGRASRLGERSRGFQDAGATSCNLILKSFAKSIIKITS
ncbi:MAG TPA: dihydroxyacetone kinase subunit L [Eubacteriaceae bacterium]|jgi:dihydroxyacetone kinase-like protein|nr:dihydroxyacetone kinase subunit L [Eubacteriaceae bacterium]